MSYRTWLARNALALLVDPLDAPALRLLNAVRRELAKEAWWESVDSSDAMLARCPTVGERFVAAVDLERELQGEMVPDVNETFV